jgi:tetratricopeptide (TPR) repeat protein
MAKAVSPIDIEAICQGAVNIKRLDMLAGGAEAAQQMLRVGNDARSMWQRPCPPALRESRATGVAWAMNNLAWSLHDAGRDGHAGEWWHLAARVARDAHNPSLTARIFGQLARQRLQLGQPQQCLDLTQLALENDSRKMLASTELAMLWALRARAHADMGQATNADDALHRALNYWHQRKRTGEMVDRPWSQHFDEGHLYGDLAAAWRALLEHGARVATNALGAYDHAIALQHPNNRRTRALQEVGRAMVNIGYGDLERGVDAAGRALDIGRVGVAASGRRLR